MFLVAKHKSDGSFFRSQSVKERDIDKAKESMENDAGEDLMFELKEELD